MNNFNMCVIEGFIQEDPKIQVKEGETTCYFTVASAQSYTDKEGKKIEDTSYFNVTAGEENAEKWFNHLRQGMRVLVTGNLVQEAYSDGKEYVDIVSIKAKELNYLSDTSKK